MRKIEWFIKIPVSFFIVLLLHGCTKDTCSHTYSYSWFQPVYKTTEEVRANIKSSPPKEIKVPGKLFIKQQYIFLNELNKGVHIIDNSNPAAPVNKAFIAIPGNIDIAVKGNILYADFFTDLVAIDITDPLNASPVKFIDDLFPQRSYGFSVDNNKIVVDWIRYDTTITDKCNRQWAISLFEGDGVMVPSSQVASSANFSGGSPVGIAGSMARFALVNNYLYTVGDWDMNVMDIAVPESPVNVNKLILPWGIETIYPFKDKLFIGSNSGMFIYSIDNAAAPQQLGTFSHARVCDPVIAEDDYAYVTLRDGTECLGFLNELDVVDISSVTAPVLKKKYSMTNPHGLSKDGNILFICDGRDGVKIFDAADVNNITLTKHITGLDTYDIIAYNGLALVVAKDGLYQFDYNDLNNIHQLSKISIEP